MVQPVPGAEALGHNWRFPKQMNLSQRHCAKRSRQGGGAAAMLERW
jgi:hypothetical protein